MFKFDESSKVVLKKANANLGLRAGAAGRIWARYETDPISYEVTFKGDDGSEFDALILEAELSTAPEIKRKIKAHLSEAS